MPRAAGRGRIRGLEVQAQEVGRIRGEGRRRHLGDGHQRLVEHVGVVERLSAAVEVPGLLLVGAARPRDILGAQHPGQAFDFWHGRSRRDLGAEAPGAPGPGVEGPVVRRDPLVGTVHLQPRRAAGLGRLLGGRRLARVGPAGFFQHAQVQRLGLGHRGGIAAVPEGQHAGMVPQGPRLVEHRALGDDPVLVQPHPRAFPLVAAAPARDHQHARVVQGVHQVVGRELALEADGVEPQVGHQRDLAILACGRVHQHHVPGTAAPRAAGDRRQEHDGQRRRLKEAPVAAHGHLRRKIGSDRQTTASVGRKGNDCKAGLRVPAYRTLAALMAMIWVGKASLTLLAVTGTAAIASTTSIPADTCANTQ